MNRRTFMMAVAASLLATGDETEGEPLPPP
jgi:hypothetical protein